MGARGVDADERERLRGALETAIARSSLRTVAEAVGMSPSGLSNFLEGARPYAKTVNRLRRWEVLHAAQTRKESQEHGEVVRNLVRKWWLADLPEEEREDALRQMLNTVREIYRRHGRTPPVWLGEGAGEEPGDGI